MEAETETDNATARPTHPPPAYTPARTPQKTPPVQLRRHIFTLFLALPFIALLVVPWASFCALESSPLGSHGRSYSIVNGTLREDDAETQERYLQAMTVLNTIAAILTIPVLSAVLNHAAVVAMLRRKPGQKLDGLQMFSMIDAPWSRLMVPWQRHNLFRVGFALVSLGSLQLFLQSILVTLEPVQISTFLDAPDVDLPEGWYTSSQRYKLGGTDPGPGLIANVPISAVQYEVASRLAVESYSGYQPRLWFDRGATTNDREQTYFLENYHQSFESYEGDYWLSSYYAKRYFASVFPADFDTGVLRYHATRLNSSISCSGIANTTFPETCPGLRPFIGDATIYGGNDTADTISVRWCVPGAYDTSPWTLSRNRQDITEELFLDVSSPSNSSIMYQYEPIGSFTVHCTANTTRGAFELPNSFNGHKPGPLLEKWPSSEELEASYNDKDNSISKYYQAPPETDDSTPVYYDYRYHAPDPYDMSSQHTPGPLTTSMMAMLGNGSWFQLVQNETAMSDPKVAASIFAEICSSGMPLMNWDDSYLGPTGFSEARSSCTGSAVDKYIHSYQAGANELAYMTYAWLNTFSNSDVGESSDRYDSTEKYNAQSLLAALFFANEATLTRATGSTSYGTSYVQVHSSPGRTITRPRVPIGAKVVISLFLGVEVLGLIGLLVYIYQVPTFGRRVDAIATAVIGTQFFAAGRPPPPPPLGGIDDAARLALAERDGLIGVIGGQTGVVATAAAAEEGAAPGPRASYAARELPRLPDEARSSRTGRSPSPPAIELGVPEYREHDWAASTQAPSGSLAVGATGLIPRRVKTKKPETVT